MDASEVDPGGRLGPVGAVPEVDRVQILGQDLHLPPLTRQVVSERRLAELFEDRSVALLGERVLDKLLRDRGGALSGAAGDVREQRSRDPPEVDAGVAPEPLVLDRDDGVAHHPTELRVSVDHLRRRVLEDPDRAPVVVVQERVRCLVELRSVLDLR